MALKYLCEMIFWRIAAVLLSILSIQACSPGTKTTKSERKETLADTAVDVAKKPKLKPAFKYDFKSQEWSTFTSKLDIQYESAQYPLPVSSFSGQLKMIKGESIWMTVSVPLIGEVGRALITKDSIIILNKYQRCFYKEPYQFISRFISIPISLPQLQELFIGNPVVSTKQTLNDTAGMLLKATLEDSSMVSQFIGSLSQLWVDKASFIDKKFKKDLQMEYQNRNPQNGNGLPNGLILNVTQPAQVMANITFLNISLNQPVVTEVKIPTSYSQCKK